MKKRIIELSHILSPGIEERGKSFQEAHCLLFENNIPLIECLCNLKSIKSAKFTIFVLPIRIKGVEAVPVRVIAVEKI